MARVLIKAPKTAKKGEVVTLAAMIAHPMETGHRRDAEGQAIPRDIISAFHLPLRRRGGVPRRHASCARRLSADAVHSRGEAATGPIQFEWRDEKGAVWKETASIVVEG